MSFEMIIALIACIVSNILLSSIEAKDIPNFIKICKRNDPKLDICVRNSVHSLRPHLQKGIAELKIPSLEPLVIGELNILDGGENGLTVKVNNLKIFGASDFEITNLTVSSDIKQFDFNLKLPSLKGFGDYEISGRLLTLPLSGKGPFRGNFTDFSASVSVTFNLEQAENAEKVSIDKLIVKIGPGNGKIRLENLFNGEKITGNTVNKIINDNFQMFMAELLQPIQRALEQKFTKISAKILENFTYNELFPAN